MTHYGAGDKIPMNKKGKDWIVKEEKRKHEVNWEKTEEYHVMVLALFTLVLLRGKEKLLISQTWSPPDYFLKLFLKKATKSRLFEKVTLTDIQSLEVTRTGNRPFIGNTKKTVENSSALSLWTETGKYKDLQPLPIIPEAQCFISGHTDQV